MRCLVSQKGRKADGKWGQKEKRRLEGKITRCLEGERARRRREQGKHRQERHFEPRDMYADFFGPARYETAFALYLHPYSLLLLLGVLSPTTTTTNPPVMLRHVLEIRVAF